jgi:hypothetical protein
MYPLLSKAHDSFGAAGEPFQHHLESVPYVSEDVTARRQRRGIWSRKDRRRVRVANAPSTQLRQLHQPGQLNPAGRDERHYFVWARVGQAVNRQTIRCRRQFRQRSPQAPRQRQHSVGCLATTTSRPLMTAALPRLEIDGLKGNCNIQRDLPEL